MAITKGYGAPDGVSATQLAALRLRLEYTDSEDTTDDPILSSIIEAVSRNIDDYTDRFFYALAAQALTYTARSSGFLAVYDLRSVDSLKTDADGDGTFENTWASTDYILQPSNANTFGKPYTKIVLTHQSNFAFPVGIRDGVEITGDWSYAATIPFPIVEACLLQSARVFKRKDAIFGVAGTANFGQVNAAIRIVDFDPDVQRLLNGFRRGVGMSSR